MTQNTTFLPEYDFSPELNAEILRKVLPLMIQNGVPVNPMNYAIWYEYVLGSNTKLIAIINTLIADKIPFDSKTSFKIYTKHICNASIESFEKVNTEIQKILTQTQVSLTDTHSKTKEVNSSFERNTGLLENMSTPPELQLVLTDILQKTNSLAQSSIVMQSSLEEANKELEQIRSELTEIRQLAITDSLTGLHNRRSFDDELDKLLNRKNAESICLVVLDIDHFKLVNDAYGHVVGDQVIKYTAALIKKCTESHHLNARYGGEEMAIIMPNTSRQRALEIAENIRSSMEKSLLKRKDSGEQLHKITVSLGLSELRNEDNAESLISRADKALYRAKESGRNLVMLEID